MFINAGESKMLAGRGPGDPSLIEEFPAESRTPTGFNAGVLEARILTWQVGRFGPLELMRLLG
jgi:hypothetical protein